jgi:hypothetical protein
LVAGEHDISAPLRRALEARGQQAPAGKPVLELNVDHHLVKYLEKREDRAEFQELALVCVRTGDAPKERSFPTRRIRASTQPVWRAEYVQVQRRRGSFSRY